MPLTPNEEKAPENGDVSIIDWVPGLRRLWFSRKRVLLGAGGLGILAAIVTFALGRYESQGLYQLYVPSLRAAEAGSSLTVGLPTFGDYKLISSLIAEPNRMREYLAAKGMDSDDDVSGLPKSLLDPVAQRQLISPVYAFTKADAKEFAENISAKEAAGQVLGLNVATKSRSMDVAQKRNRVLAEYVRDAVFLQAMTDYIRVRDDELRRSALAYENAVIADRYKLKFANDKMRELRAVGVRNPDARADGRTVVSLSDSTVRFLSLPTQVVAEEIRAVDLNMGLEKARRERDQTEYTIAYFEALKKAILSARTAEAVIKAMPEAKSAADKGRDLNDEKIKQVSNATQLEILSLQDAYYNRSRFVVGPTRPERSLTMPLLAFVLGSLAGLGGMAGYVMLRGWFGANIKRIVGGTL